MKLLIFPMLVTIGYFGFIDRDKVVDLYRAAYPADAAKRETLEQCARTRNFNRLDSTDRQSCYAGTWGRMAGDPAAIAPRASPSYEFSPSRLPGNDIRRQEANDTYRLPELVRSAQAAPLLPVPVSLSQPRSPPPATIDRAGGANAPRRAKTVTGVDRAAARR